MTTVLTLREVCGRLRVGERKIRGLAHEHGIGYLVGGRSGWRFTEADVEQLVEAMRPAAVGQPSERRRQRRGAVL